MSQIISQLVPFKVKVKMPENPIRISYTPRDEAGEEEADKMFRQRLKDIYARFLDKEWTVVGVRKEGIVDEFLLVREGELSYWMRKDNCEVISTIW